MMAAVQERHPNFLFQIANLLAYHRLRYMEGARSTAEPLPFGRRAEIPQVSQFHFSILSVFPITAFGTNCETLSG
jgi:hypothetical protein